MGDQEVRALVVPWRTPGSRDADVLHPAEMTHSLWIDTKSMLPIRSSVSMHAGANEETAASADYGIFFMYDPSIRLVAPDGVTPPDCIA